MLYEVITGLFRRLSRGKDDLRKPLAQAPMGIDRRETEIPMRIGPVWVLH